MRWGKRLVVVAGAAVVIGALAAVPATAQASPTDGTPLCAIEAPAATAVTRPPDDGVLRVATFNVLHSETDEGDLSLGARLPLLADAIVTSRADIVGAQEVTRNLGFDNAAEYPQKHGLVARRLAAAVAARTNEPWGWCWSLSNPHVPLSPDLNVGGGNPLDDQAAANGNIPEPGDFAEGVAILTRFPIADSRFRRLPIRAYEAPGCLDLDPFCPFNAVFDSRQVLWARVTTPAGAVDMFTTHIAHQLTELSDTTKLIQTQAAIDITEEWATDDSLPDYLVGDFNSTPGSAVHAEALGRGFVDAYKASGGVECGANGTGGCSGGPKDGEEVHSVTSMRPMSGRIDYVFVRPPAACALRLTDAERVGDTGTRLVDGRYLWPSDHYGFAASSGCGAAATAAPTSTSATPNQQPTPAGTLPATGDDMPVPVPVLALAFSLALVVSRGRRGVIGRSATGAACPGRLPGWRPSAPRERSPLR